MSHRLMVHLAVGGSETLQVNGIIMVEVAILTGWRGNMR